MCIRDRVGFTYQKGQVYLAFRIPQLHHRFRKIVLIRQAESGEVRLQKTKGVDRSACNGERVTINDIPVILHCQMHICTVVMLLSLIHI